MPVTIIMIITSSIGIMMIIIIVLQFELLLAKKKRCQFGSKRKKNLQVNSHTFQNQFEAICTKVDNILYLMSLPREHGVIHYKVMKHLAFMS